MHRIEFCGEMLPRLGFGTMRLPVREDRTVDEEKTAEMIRYAMAHGVNYFDTAYPYHDGKSEVITGKILREFPRDSFFLADKYPGHQIADSYDPESVFAALHMGRPAKLTAEDGKEVLAAGKNSAGVWGAWICHVGILLLIAGFALGQMTQKENVVWGIPGETKDLPETGLQVTIEDFRTETREDGSVGQYVTDIAVTDPNTGKTEKASVSVNHPAAFGGFRLYQNNTGPAAEAVVEKNGQEIQRKTLLPQQGMAESVLGLEDQPEYAFYFAGIRTMAEEGQEERTLWFFDLYREGVLQQNYYFFGEGTVDLGETHVTFNPRSFTLLVARQDRFEILALAGGLIMMAGLLMAFCLQPKTLWAIRGEGGKWILRGRCRKGQALMAEQLEEAVRNTENNKRKMGR